MPLASQSQTENVAAFILVPPDMVPLTFGRDTFNEGTFAQAACIITDGDEPLSIQWSFHGHGISSDQGITTTNVGSRTSILSIGSVNHNHRGNYTCKASNLAGDRYYTAELKVNGRWENLSGGLGV
jgi:hypothetical protein